MKKWFIRQIDIDFFKQREANTFIQPKEKLNTLHLYNKNSNTYSYFRNPRPAIDRFGVIVERGNRPRYFKSIMKPA
jgi:hypothetical protein